MSLHFSRIGRGNPVVLIHGLFGSLENLAAMSRYLAEYFEVYSIDLPNHGRSMHTPTTGLPLLANQVHDWLHEQAIESPVLIGHSLGGKVAMEVALRFNSSAKKLVVLDIAPARYVSRHEKIFTGLHAINFDNISTRRQADEVLSAYEPEAAVRGFLLKNLEKTTDGLRWKFNLPVLSECYSELIEANTKKTFDEPTLFLKAENSDYINDNHKNEVESRFSNANFKIVADVGHWLHAEKPELVATLIRKFIVN